MQAKEKYSLTLDDFRFSKGVLDAGKLFPSSHVGIGHMH